jgi:putative acetyltransferase
VKISYKTDKPHSYMKPIIRPIVLQDNQVIANVIRETLAEFGANHPGTVYYDASTDHLYELFQQEGSAYWVVEDNGVVKGGGGIFPSPGLPADTVELVKMYLLPEMRGTGLGRAMIQKCIDEAKARGYKKMYIETMPELRQAMRTYEKFGFQYLSGPMGNTGHFGCEIWMMLDLEY